MQSAEEKARSVSFLLQAGENISNAAICKEESRTDRIYGIKER
jgi:hypothetical protein